VSEHRLSVPSTREASDVIRAWRIVCEGEADHGLIYKVKSGPTARGRCGSRGRAPALAAALDALTRVQPRPAGADVRLRNPSEQQRSRRTLHGCFRAKQQRG
jgi:hypothetical protein